MTCTNELYKLKTDSLSKNQVWQDSLNSLVACIAPFAPHLSEELWHQLEHSSSVHKDSWPKLNEAYLVQDTTKIIVQINGKLRGEIQIPTDSSEDFVINAAKAVDKISGYLNGQTIQKTIYIPSKLVNFVV
jgi:leucyl-tRNA synthetase